ncbi:hypothetical protein [Shigella sonnei]|uniref:hypothetical protein n=1 Tax=Shigella sonnei TaxID=624 RepID=UPI00092D40C8|nr:hypothetical protein [Shigella sonnei]
MAESGYGLAGLGVGKVKSINPYRLTPGFGGFTPLFPGNIPACNWPGLCSRGDTLQPRQ